MSNSLINNENGDVTSESKELTEPVNLENEEENVPLTNGIKEIDSESETKETTDHVDNKKDEWIDLLGSGAVMKKIIIEGKSETRPQRSEKCVINYICSFDDDTVINSAENFELRLGESDVR